MTESTTPPAGTAAAKRAWWGDRGVKVKVLTAVGVASGVATLVGVLGLSALGTSAQTSHDIYEINAKSLVNTGDMRAAFGTMRVKARDAVIQSDPQVAQKSLDAVATAEKAFRDAETAYTAEGMTPAKTAVANDAMTAFNQWVQVQTQQMAPLALANNGDAWLQVLNTQAQPLSDKVQADVEKLAGMEASEAQARATAADSSYRSQRTTSVLILVIGVLAAIGLGVAVATGIARATRKVQAVTTALAAGDLTSSSGLTTRDELGRMGASLDEAVVSLRSVMATVVASADAVAASSEELSASAAQISASAEETSA